MATKSVRVMGEVVLVETDDGVSIWSTDGQRMRLVPDDGGQVGATVHPFAESLVATARNLVAQALLEEDADEARLLLTKAERALANAVDVQAQSKPRAA